MEVKPIANSTTALPVFTKPTTITHKLKSFHLNSRKIFTRERKHAKMWLKWVLRHEHVAEEEKDCMTNCANSAQLSKKKQARKNRNGLFRFLCLLFGKLLKQNLISCNIQQVGVWWTKNVKSTKFIIKLQVWQMQKCRRNLNCCNFLMVSRFLCSRFHHFYYSFSAFFPSKSIEISTIDGSMDILKTRSIFPKTTKGLNLRIVILPEIELDCCH